MALEIGDSQIERNQNLAAGANLKKRKREHRKDKTDNSAVDRIEKKKKKEEINGECNGHGDTNVTVAEDNNKVKKREKKEGHIKSENTSLGNLQQDDIAEQGKKKKKRRKGEKTRRHEDNVPNTDKQDVESDEKKKRKRERKSRREANENALEEDAQQADAGMEQTEETNGAVETTSAKNSKKKKRRDQQEARRTSTTTDATSSRSSTSVSGAEISEYLAKHGATIDCGSGSLPSNLNPILSFSSLLPRLPEPLHNAFDSFKEPTPIQACSWPASLDGRDVVGIAETGSGKTLAFGVPAIAHIAKNQNNPLPSSKKSKSKHFSKKSQAQVLVVAPTRELALQTHETFTELGKPFGLTSVAVYGGVDKDPQRRALSQAGAAMVVGTPGRILDLVINEGACDLSGVTYLVLDEADRMLDRGFENDIRAIFGLCAPSEQRQTLMFSATWPDAVRRLASTFQRNPVRITVGSDDLTANRRVEQVVEVFDDQYEKDSRLLSHLQKLKPRSGRSNTQSHSQPQDDSRILVFVLYKKEATRVEQTLLRHKFSVSSIHGDLSQSARISALENFKKGETQILVATDVAARGLDIPSVGLVLNYSFPLTVEDYVHRIGRTGRGGRSGKSITFFTGDNHEKALAGELAKVMREGGFDASPLKKFPMTIKKKEHGVYGAFYRDDIPASATPTHMKF